MPGLLNPEYQAGKEIQVDDVTLTPFVKTWRLHSPGRPAGFIWSKPASVLVHGANGEEQIVPIPDLTWRLIGSLIGACLGAAVLIWIISKAARR